MNLNKLSAKKKQDLLFQAVRKQDLVCIDALLRGCVDTAPTQGGRALYVAAGRGLQKIFAYLIENGFQPVDPCGYMEHAVQSQSGAMVNWLRQQPWHTKQADTAGLCTALTASRYTVLDEWVNDEAVLNQITPASGVLNDLVIRCPLTCAAFHSQHWVIPLMEKGADPHFIVDPTHQRSVFHLICSQAGLNTDVIPAMLTFPVNIDIEDKDGNTPLFLAAKAGLINRMTSLVEHGANPNHKNADGSSLLDVAKSFPLMGFKTTAQACAARLLSQWQAEQLQNCAAVAISHTKARL